LAQAYWLSLAVEDVSPQGNRDKASSQMCSIKSVFSPFWSILSASSQDVDGGTLRGRWADQERGWASVVVGDWRCSVMMELVGSAASLCNKHGKTFKWLSMRARRSRFASSSAQLEAIFIKHLAFNKSFRLVSMCNQSLIIARSRLYFSPPLPAAYRGHQRPAR
jgi:hypothetical protein